MSDTPVPQTPPPRTPREIRLEEMFVQYVSMGSGRRYGALAKETGVPASELVRHATKFLWRERVAMIHSEANERTREELVETLADVNKRHVSDLRILQKKAMKFLENQPIEKPQDAIKLIGMAMKMEREAHGLDKNSEQSRLQDLLEGKLEKLLDAPKPADVIEITEYPDPVNFDAGLYPEPHAEDSAVPPEPDSS